MRSILKTVFLAAATFSLSALAEFDPNTNTDGQDKDNPRDGLQLRTATDLGCFESPGKMFDMGVYTFQTPGWCQPLCVRLAKNYFALVNGTNCFCGDAPPSNDFKVDNSSCQTTCGGYEQSYCGGINFWNVQIANYKNGDPTGSAKITIPAPTYTYMGAGGPTESASTTVPATVVVTRQATSSATATAQPQSSGPNTAAIAAGIVVAIVVVTAIAGGVFFFMRRKKQQVLAEEQRRHEIMTNFVTAEKPRSGYTSPDSRLDPSLMFQRRLSDGSIRDNEDYSRRILKVANPDD